MAKDIRIIPASGQINVTGSADFVGTGKTSVLYVSGSGRVGVGTTDPSDTLHVDGTLRTTAVTGNRIGDGTDTTKALSILDTSMTAGDTNIVTLGRNAANNNQAEITFHLAQTGSTSNRLQLGLYNSPDTLNILGSGNVGIGSNAPTSRLNVKSTDSTTDQITLTHSGNTVKIAALGQESSHGSLILRANSGVNKVRLSAAGNNSYILDSNVGIGTTSPTYQLDVSGSSRVLNGTLFLDSSTVNGTSNRIIRFTEGVGTSAQFQGGYIQYDADSNRLNLGIHDAADSNTANDVVALSLKRSDNSVRLNQYGSGNFTGTAAYTLQVDSTGLIIENPIGAGAVDGTGASNYLTRWEDADTVTSSSVYESGTNIGIGTTVPTAKVDIYKSGSLVFNVRGSQGQLFSVTDSLVGSLMSVNDISGLPILEVFDTDKVVMGTFGENTLVVTGSSVGIGTDTPSYPLDVKGQTRLDSAETVPTNAKLLVGSVQNAGSSAIAQFGGFIRLSDGVYIHKSGDTTQSFQVGYGANGLRIRREGGSGNANVLLAEDNGDVGIGVTNPSAKLQVNGDWVNNYGSINISHSANTLGGLGLRANGIYKGGLIYRDGTAGTYWELSSYQSEPFLFRTNNTERMRIKEDGNIGIGITSPEQKLHLSGNFLLQNNNEIRSKDTGGTQRTITRVNSSNELEFGWSGNGPVKFMGGGSYTERMRITTDGDVTIKQDLTVEGIVTAKEFHTQFVSASIIYQSGSTQFGDTTDDNHRFTGSLEVLTDTAAGNRTFIIDGQSGPRLQRRSDTGGWAFEYGFKANDDTDLGGFGAYSGISNGLGRYYIGTYSSNERVSILDNGNVGLGYTAPDHKLKVGGSIYANTVSYANGGFRTTEANTGYTVLSRNSSGNATLYVQSATTTTNQPIARFYYGDATPGSGTEVLNVAKEKSYFKATRLGIGTTDPVPHLHLTYTGGTYSTDATSGFINQADSGRATMRLRSITDNPAELFFDVSGSIRWDISTRGSSDNYDLMFFPQAATPALNAVGSHTFKLAQNGDVIVTGAGSSGKMGIGTASPSEKLDVVGNAEINGRLYINKSGENTRFNSADANGPYVSFRNNGTAKGYIGSGFHLWGSPNNSADNLGIRAENRLDFGIASSVKMTLNSSGNIGIGTTSPAAKLHVYGGGNTIFEGPSATNIDVRYRSAGTNVYNMFYQASSDSWALYHNVGSAYRIFVSGSGNVGIGNTTPGYKLDVSGTGRFTGELRSDYAVQVTDVDGAGNIAPGTDFARFTGYGIIGNRGTFYVTNTSGNVQIGAGGTHNDSPVATFKNDGQVRLHDYGQGSYTANSVYRLAVDANGNIIEESLGDGSINGLGASRYFARWSDTDSLTTSSMYEDENGNIGIGTINPAADLYVNSSNNLGLTLQHASRPTLALTDGTNYSYIGLESGGAIITGTTDNDLSIRSPRNIVFGGNSVARMTIENAGNVGVGTINPGSNLHVYGDTSGTISSLIQNVNTGSGAYAAMRLQSDFEHTYAPGVFLNSSNNTAYAGANTLMLYQYHEQPIALTTNNIVRLTVTGAGKVGIGTTNPIYRLDIESGGSSEAFGLSISGTERLKMYADGTWNYYQAKSGQSHRFTTTGGALFSVMNDGNLGINTASPYAPLHIKETGTPTTSGQQGYFGKLVLEGDDGYWNRLRFDTEGTGSWGVAVNPDRKFAISRLDSSFTGVPDDDNFVIDTNGKVGIGTASPTATLEVSSGQSDLRVTSTTGGESARVMFKTTTREWRLGTFQTQGNNFWVYDGTAGAYRMAIDTSGNVGIGTTSPSGRLHVHGSNPILYLSSNASGESTAINFDEANTGNINAQIFWSGSDNKLHFRTYTSGDVMTITDGGRVGINTISPNTELEVAGTIRAEKLESFNGGRIATLHDGNSPGINLSDNLGDLNWVIGADDRGGVGSAGQNAIVIRTNTNSVFTDSWVDEGTEVFTLDDSGNLGLGVVAPTYKLDVAGNIRTTGPITVETNPTDHSGSNWYSIADSHNIVQVTDGRDVYIEKEAGAAGYGYFAVSPEEVGENFDISFRLKGGTPSGYRHLAIAIGNDGSNTTSNFDYIVLRHNTANSANNQIRIDVAGSTQQSLVGSSIPDFYDGTERHILIQVRNKQYVVEVDGVVEHAFEASARTSLRGLVGFAIYETAAADTWVNIRDFNITQYSDSRTILPASVGIGTTDPVSDFHVNGDRIIFTQTGQTYTDGSSGLTGIGIRNTGTSAAYNAFGIETGAGSIFQVRNNGHVVIGRGGTDDRDAYLIIDGGSGGSGEAFLSLKRNSTQQFLLNTTNTETQVRNTGNLPIHFYTNDSQRLTIAAAGNVGIGSNSPGAKLDVAGTVRLGVMTGYQETGAVLISRQDGTDRSHRIVGYNTNVAADNYLRFDVHNGNVSSYQTALTLRGDGSSEFAGDVTVDGILTAREFHTTFVSASIIFQSGSTVFGNSTDDIHEFTGKVGINTNNPQVELHVKGNNGWGETRIEGQTFASGHGGSLEFYSEGTALADIYASTDKHLYFRTNGTTERMRINANGRVGIGTTGPGTIFHVKGGTSDGWAIFERGTKQLYVNPNYSGLDGFAQIAPKAGDDMDLSLAATDSRSSDIYIKHDTANVGIGTTAPDYKLDVTDSARIDGVRLGRDFSIANRATVRLDANGNAPADILFGQTVAANETSWNGVYWSISSRESGGGAAQGQKFTIWRGNEHASPNNSENQFLTITPDLKMGVGTTNPTQKLDVAGYARATSGFVGSTNLKLYGDNTSTEFVQVNTDGTVQMTAYGVGYLKSDAAGDITVDNSTFLTAEADTLDTVTDRGATTTNSITVGEIIGQGSANGDIDFRFKNNSTGASSAGNVWIYGEAVSTIRFTKTSTSSQRGTIVYDFDNEAMGFRTNGVSNRLYINSSGNVGIGITAPAVKLHVEEGVIRATGTTSAAGQIDASPSYGAFRFYDGSTFYGGLGMGQWAGAGANTDIVQYLSSGVNYHVSNTTTPVLTVSSGGSVGIGTTSPGAHLDIVNTSGDADIALRGSNSQVLRIDQNSIRTTSNSQIAIFTNNSATNGIYIASNGSVGVGTTSPVAKLEVAGNIERRGSEINPGALQLGTKNYSLAYHWTVDEGAIGTNTQVRTNTHPDGTEEVTAMGRVTSLSSGAASIVIPNNKKYRKVYGYLRVRVQGSMDGWRNSSATIDNNIFMDGVAITGTDAAGSNETWIWGVVVNNYDAAENVSSKPSFVGEDYQTYLTTHGVNFPNNWTLWDNYDDNAGRSPVKSFYFERELTSDLDGDIEIRLMSDQSSGNNEDVGLEEFAIYVAPEKDSDYDDVVNVGLGTPHAPHRLTVEGDISGSGKLYAGTVDNATVDTDKFLVLNGEEVEYRTGTQVLSDIGGISGVTWPQVGAGQRTNYDLDFKPPTSGYAGFRFTTAAGANGGYFLIRGTSDNGVYKANGITLVGDGGWLTLAQRTSTTAGIRFMTGDTSTEKMIIDNSGDVGIGATPHTAGPTWRTFYVGSSATIISRQAAAGNDMMLANNHYIDSSNVDKRITAGGTSRLFINEDVIRFQYSATGAADSTITWSESMRIAADGNVGIGTTDPGAKLDVIGNGRFYSAIGANDDVRTGIAHYDTTAQAAGVGGQLVLGYKYIGDTNYTEGAIIKMYKLNSTSGDYSSGLKFQVRNSGAALSTKMTLDPSGNLGIGVTNPGYKLEINGNVYGTTTAQFGTSYIVGNQSNWAIFGSNSTSNGVKVVLDGNVNRNDLVVATSGNVGVGTGTPSARLDVYKSGSIVFNVGGSQGQLFSVTDSLQGSLMSVNDISGIPILEVFDTDKVVMGTFGQNTLVVTGSVVGVGTGTPFSTATNNTGLHIDTGGHSSLQIGDGVNDGGMIQSSDNVQRIIIGANVYDSPVGSWSRFTADSAALVDVYGEGSSAFISFNVDASNSGYPTERMIIKNNGNVGINKTNPSRKLEVGGDFEAESITINNEFTFPTSDGSSGQVLQTNGSGTVTWAAGGGGSASTIDVTNTTSGTGYRVLFIDNSGTTDETIYVRDGGLEYDPGNSDLKVSGNVISYATSDRALKDNLTPIPNALEKISQVSGYEFDWNDKQTSFTGHDVGVVAQEIEAILPELVNQNENGYKAVKYEKIVPLLIEGVKEQQTHIQRQQKEIDELRSELKAIRDMLLQKP